MIIVIVKMQNFLIEIEDLSNIDINKRIKKIVKSIEKEDFKIINFLELI